MLAADLLDLTEGDPSPEARRAAGLALLLGQHVSDAARECRLAVSHTTNSKWWSDLAAMEVLAARKTGDGEHLLDALAAVDRAIEIDPALPEALFNRAVIVEEMGLRHPAIECWRRFLRQELDSSWATEARRRLHADQVVRSDADEWRQLNVGVASLTFAELSQATERLPEQARRTAEGPLLAAWAAAVETGNAAVALRNLAAARSIGRSLHQRYGDASVADFVEAIDRASALNQRRLAKAYMAYRSGRLALRAMNVEGAVQALTAAAALFTQAGSPMALVAEYYVAAALRNANRVDEARQRLERLLSMIRPDRYASLVAQAQRELSLCYGTLGRWHEALDLANAAATAFHRLGENQNAGDVGIVLIGLSDMTGQRAESIDLVVRTLRELSTAGADDRVASALAASGHAEVRRGHWDNARALAMIERELPATRNDPQLRTDNLIRLAAIELHAGNTARAEQIIARAASAAGVVPGQLGAKLMADVDAVGGAIVRHRDPARAVVLLARSIAFQRRTGRLYALPEIYLESARAHVTAGDRAGAAADYEAGIVALEQQRSHAVEVWRRIGIFDNAVQLFDEAASLALITGEVDRAFAYVERRRGRVLLDELATKQRPLLAGLDATSLRASMPGNAVLVEYATLGQSTEVFVVTREQIKARPLPASTAAVRAQVRALVEELMRDGDFQSTLQELYELLIGPIGPFLDGREMLVVVPESWLQRVPFAALIDPRQQRYLIERQIVVLAPSAATFVKAAANTPAMPRPPRAATFGNPTLGANSQFGPLPLAEKEAVTIARLYPHSARWIGHAATKEAFVAALATFDLIHFAGHAISLAREPWQSALLFSSGPLPAREIVASKGVAARVVILAACGTARGEPAVEGAPVLAQAFLIAGVPSIVGTLWDVEDGDAGQLMYELHKYLARGTQPALALQQAQLSMLRSARMADRNPLKWASFVCIGAP